MNYVNIALVLGTFTGVGPIDAYRANFKDIRVSIDFTCSYFQSTSISSTDDLRNNFPETGPANKASHIINCTWEYDGKDEHYIVRTVGGENKDPSNRRNPVAPSEMLSDRFFVAHHFLDLKDNIMHVSKATNGFPFPTIGPFTLSTNQRIDQRVENYNTSPVRKTIIRGTSELELEIYEKIENGFTIRDEIFYNPNLGFLAELYRVISFGVDSTGLSVASIREYRLLNAQPSSSGSFVPLKWAYAQYDFENFDKKYPNYSENTNIMFDHEATIVFCQVDRLHELPVNQPIKANLSEVHFVFAPGGPMSVPSNLRNVNLGDLKHMLGKALEPSNKSLLPNINTEEVHEFDKPNTSNMTYLVFGGLGLIFVLWFAIRYKLKTRILPAVAIVCSIIGCNDSSPVLKLTAKFTPSHILYVPPKTTIPTTLRVQNDGDTDLKIFDISTGCSCRAVDKSIFPLALDRGASVNIALSMSDKGQTNPQSLNFTFSTDKGPISVSCLMQLLPCHSFSPRSVTLSGVEADTNKQPLSFSVSFREILSKNQSLSKVKLSVPPEITSALVSTKAGRIVGVQDASFKDDVYQFQVNTTKAGLYKKEIVLIDQEEKVLATIPVVWQIKPYMYATPDRITVSAKPVRTFLVCSNKSAEFVRILNCPVGINAVIVSTREINISLVDNYEKSIDDVVTVTTNDRYSPVLSIRVVKFARGETGT